MRIAIDAHALGRGQAGYESYLRHLTAALPEAAPEHEFLLYRDLPRGRLRRLAWELPRRLFHDRPDVLHVQYAAPFPCPAPVVATVHDLSFEDVPEFIRPAERALLRAAVRRTVAMARRVITVSEFSRRRLMAVYGLPEEKIVVAPNAAGPAFRPSLESPRPNPPYILMVGDLHPRKNHLGLIRAFAAFANHHPHRLLIVGRDTWFAGEIRRVARESGAGNRILFLGYVPDGELPGLYRGADLSVYPSFYEGFGLPVVEAMACRTPMVTSRTTALAEVAGDAAILADPRDPRDLCQAMEAALAHAGYLRAAGLARAAQFSWRDAARITVRAYKAASPFGVRRLAAAFYGRSLLRPEAGQAPPRPKREQAPALQMAAPNTNHSQRNF